MRWSDLVAQRFDLQLPPDLRAWLDDEIWKQAGGAEFCRPRSPQQILSPEPGSIWAGFMLPDTLPLIGNQYGDWLCLRIGFSNRVEEVLYWCHGGGDWIPYGRTLSEALIYDAAFHLLYDRRTTAEFSPQPPAAEVYIAADWAWQWTDRRAALEKFWLRDSSAGPAVLQQLLAAGVAEVAVRRDLILRHLESQLKARSRPAVAAQVGANWEPDFVSWLFDTALIPELTRDQLGRLFGVPVERLMLQDWGAAEQEALRVIAARHDLEWAFDIAGWAAERRGAYREAASQYLAGLHASSFSDHAVRFRTHWFDEGFGKFAAARLHHLRGHLTNQEIADRYLQIFWHNDAATLRQRVHQYWQDVAERESQQGNWQSAYRAYYAAGWDCGLTDVQQYADILERLADVADHGGSTALAHLARMHREHL
jgi:hypothetical protein